jgi:glycerol-3-phosphate dehydrogenase
MPHSSAGLAERVAVGCPVIKAEIAHAVRAEMAMTLADAVLRRTALAHLGDPGEEVAAGCRGDGG